jgi:hypothetical protein
MSEKLKILHNFLNKHKYLPVQGSQEWLKSRSETIGGSEISTILGLNPYQSIKQLIKQKIGLTIFKKAPPLWFGNIFEYILQQYTEILFDTKIYETGSIPYDKSNLIKYSPDGLSVIKNNKLKFLLSKYDINNKINNLSIFNNIDPLFNKELLVLFEFKNPYMRVLKKNEIPVYYINQPRLGMEVINICEVSIFIEAIFRFCSIEDIINLNNKYNTKYHFDKIRYTNMPIAYSSFSIYYEKNNQNLSLVNLLNNLNHYLHNYSNNFEDLSSITDKNLINNIMENIIDYKDLKIIYHDICINENIYDSQNIYRFHKYNNINKFLQNISDTKNKIISDSNLEYLGIFSFKMFDINIQPIFKTRLLNNELLDKIDKVINTIKECNLIDNLDVKKKIVDNFKL